MRSFSEPPCMLVLQPSYESLKVHLLYVESQKLGSIETKEKLLFQLKYHRKHPISILVNCYCKVNFYVTNQPKK